MSQALVLWIFRGSFKTKKFNVVSITCGTLDHDIARTHKDYLHGEFELDDIELGEYGLNRLKQQYHHHMEKLLKTLFYPL